MKNSFTPKLLLTFLVWISGFSLILAQSGRDLKISSDQAKSIGTPNLYSPTIDQKAQNLAYPSLYNWIPKSSVQFEPNVGQILHDDGSPASEVKFKAHSKGATMYFTHKGVSYVFGSFKFPKNNGNPNEVTQVKPEYVAKVGENYTVVTDGKPVEVATIEMPKCDFYRMDMEFVGANPNPVIVASKPTLYYNNYRLGGRVLKDNVPNQRMVTYQEIYPNIDLVFYGSGDFVKYDFVIKPGGNPNVIRIKYNGANDVSLTKDGDLKITTQGGIITEKSPFSFQSIHANTRKEDGPSLVNSSYQVSGNEVTFNIPKFDNKRLLVIDPTIEWSTYYGGAEDELTFSTVSNRFGDSYSAGITFSTAFPRSIGPIALAGPIDGFLVKLNSAGVRTWGTYFGGTGQDGFSDVAVDAAGVPYLTGWTNSNTDFPAVTPTQAAFGGLIDQMVVRMDAAGSVDFATFLGGIDIDMSMYQRTPALQVYFGSGAIAVDANNQIVVAMNTNSPNFALAMSTSRIQLNHRSYLANNLITDVILVKYKSDLTYDWATYYGGNGLDACNDLAIDLSGNIYMTGLTISQNLFIRNFNDGSLNNGIITDKFDAFFTKISPTGDLMVASYFGGDDNDNVFANDLTVKHGIVLDLAGNIIITGNTVSTTGISTAGSFRPAIVGANNEGFVAKFLSGGGDNSQIWGTYIGGGTANDFPSDVAVYPNGSVGVSLAVGSTDFPVSGAYQPTSGSPATFFDGAIAKLSKDGDALEYGTYLGGDGTDYLTSIDVDRDGNTYVVGDVDGLGNFLSALTFQAAKAGAVDVNDAFMARFKEAAPVDAPCNGSSNGAPIQILVIQHGVDLTEEFPNTMAALDRYAQNYVLTTTTTTDPTVLTGLLVGKDVVIIPEVEDPATVLATFTNFSTALNNFATSGKTVIFLGSSNNTGGGFQAAIFNTGLFAGTWQNSFILPSVTDVDNGFTPLSNGLPSSFDMSPISSDYNVTNGVRVYQSAANHYVSYRVIGTGKAILIGADYSSYGWEQARILANAVTWPSSQIEATRFSVNYSKKDVTCSQASDGAIEINVTNAQNPVNFAWSNGKTTKNISGLTAGSYTVTVAGGRGGLCTEVLTIAVGSCGTCSPNYTFDLIPTPATQCEPAVSTTIKSVEIDGCGDYDIKTVPFGLLPVPVNAISVTGNMGDQVEVGPLPISFPFEFFCKSYSSFFMSDNGYITFNQGEEQESFLAQTIPFFIAPNNVVALAWGPMDGSTGAYRYWVQGTAPSRKLVVHYDDIGIEGGGGQNLKGQIILYEGDSIEYQIEQFQTQGDQFTQGLENFDGTRGVAVTGRNNVTGWTATNEGTRFTPKTKASDITYEWTQQPSPAIIATTADLTTTPPVGATTYELKAINLARNCSTSKSIVYTVDPATVAGTITAAQTVCSNLAPANLTLAGQTGNVVRWEKSTDSFVTNTPIAITTTTLAPGMLTTTTCFRAAVKSGTCVEVLTPNVCVTIIPGTVPGTLAGAVTVCGGTNSGTLTLSGQTGTILRWEKSTDNFVTSQTVANVTTTLSFTNEPATICYKAVVQNGTCDVLSSTTQCVTVDPPSVGGTVTASATVCSGTNSGTLTLAGHTGLILNWESALNPAFSAPVTNIANTLTTLAYTNLTVTTYYRAVVKSGVCASANSVEAEIKVDPASVGGTIAGAATVCGGTNSTNLTLSGHTGNVVRWESSTDNFATITTINNVTATLTATNVAVTTCYRAVVQSGVCPTINSTQSCITFFPASVGGATSGAVTVCSGTNSGNIDLTGHTGNVVKWEVSTDNFVTTTSISNITATFTFANLTQTSCFRAVVQSGTCATANSAQTCITVDPATVAGTVAAAQTVCAGTNTGNLTVTGLTGNVVRWESSTDNFTTVTSIANITTTLTFNNLTVLTCFRVAVKSGSCAEVTSNNVCVTISGANSSGTVAADVTVCSGTNTGNLTLSGHVGNIIRWEQSTDNFVGNTTTVSNVTATLTYNNITANTWVRAIVQGGGCPPSPSNVVKITVDPATVAGTISGINTICSGSAGPTLTLAGHVGNIERWESSTDNFTTVTTLNVVVTTLATGNLTTTTCYRSVVKSGVCASANSPSVCVTVSPTTVAGTASGAATVCSGSATPTNLTLAGNTGALVKWEQSTDNFVTTTSLTTVSTLIGISGLTATTCYRAVVQSGACAAANSNNVCITVDVPTVGGTLSASQTICSGSPAAAINLAGQTGTIVRWESSNNCGGTGLSAPIVTINNVTNTFTPTGLVVTTCYRAAIKNGACPETFSSFVTVEVSSATVAGVLSTAQSICSGSAPGLLLLTGKNGNVLNWESSTDCPTFSAPTNIANTNVTFAPPSLTTTTCYRAVVKNGACLTVNSNIITVVVSPNSVGGNLTGTKTICAGKNSGPLTLTGETGTIARWESSTNCSFTVSSLISIIANTTNTFTSGNLTTTTCFRAIAKSGACGEATSSVVEITVDQPSVGGNVLVSRTICEGSTSGSLILAGHYGTILFWQSSNTCPSFANPTNLGNAGSPLYQSGPLNTKTCFRAALRSGVCDTVFSNPATISISGLTATYTVTDIAGCLKNGSIKAIATGGALPYTYSIAPPVLPSNNTGTFANLVPGDYTITIKDGAGCLIDSLLTIKNDTSDIKINLMTITNGSAFIRWDPKPGVGVLYNYRYRPVGRPTWNVVNGTANIYAYLFGLDQYTPYQFQVQYTCPAPNEFASKWKDTTFRTLESGSCYTKTTPFPGGVYVTNITRTTCTLKWTNVTGSQGVLASLGLANLNPNTWPTFLVCDPLDSLNFTRLTGNKQYGYRVRTLCDNCTTLSKQKMSNYSKIQYFKTPSIRSEGEVLNSNGSFYDATVYPNPNKGSFNLELSSSEASETYVKMYDITGRLVLDRKVETQSGTTNLPIELNNPTSGVYILQIQSNSDTKTIKVVVE